MLFDGISKDTKRLEKAYVETLKLGQKIGVDPELQVKLEQFRQHLGKKAAAARLTDVDRKYGKASAIDEAFLQRPELKQALGADSSGELKSTLKSFGEIVKALPEAMRGVVATALLHALSEVYKLTNGEPLPGANHFQQQNAAVKAPAQAQPVVAASIPAASNAVPSGVERQVMDVLRSSSEVDLPKEVGSVKEWAAYLVAEKQQVEQGTFLRNRGLESVPEGGFIVVDVPKHAPPRIFNFRTEAELVSAADATGLKWRSQGWHPITAVGQALVDLGNRERVGLYRSKELAVADAMSPENSLGRDVIVAQLTRSPGEAARVSTGTVASVGPGIPQEQRQDLIRAMQLLEKADDGAVKRDGVGFSASHSMIGKALSNRDDLSQGEAEVARDLALIYSKQIKEVDPELFERALVGRPAGHVDASPEALKERMKWGEGAEGKSVQVGVPGRSNPRMERAEVESVGVGAGRRAGISV